MILEYISLGSIFILLLVNLVAATRNINKLDKKIDVNQEEIKGEFKAVNLEITHLKEHVEKQNSRILKLEQT